MDYTKEELQNIIDNIWNDKDFTSIFPLPFIIVETCAKVFAEDIKLNEKDTVVLKKAYVDLQEKGVFSF